MTTPAGIESPARPEVDNAAAPPAADKEASRAPGGVPPVDEAASLANAVARRRLGERLRRIAPFFADCRRGFVLAFVGAVIAAATEPAIPALLKILLDDGVKQSAIPLWAVPIAVIGITFIRGFAGFMSQYGLAWAANRGTQTMRRTMFQRVLDAEPALFTKNTASNLVNTLTFEVQNGANQLVYSLQSLVGDSLRFAALIGYLIWLNWQLTLFVAILLPAVAFVMRKFSKRLHRLTVQGQQSVDELAYVVEENVLAWRSVRLHEAQASQATRFERASNDLRRLSLKSAIAAASGSPITQVLASCALAMVIVAALWQSSRGGNSVGSFVAFIVAMLQLVPPLKHLSELAGPITRGLAALDRGVALIDTSLPERGGSFDPGRSAGHVELRGVTLAYRAGQRPALDRVDLEVRAGETVALVGPSGSGKSTVAALLPRFFDVTGGRITADGIDLRDVKLESLRKQIALVAQDTFLFHDTIRANLTWVRPEVSGDDINRALTLAMADFVHALPNGLDTVVGDRGVRLSGGERQRIALARALLRKPSLLILDEATSAIDRENEQRILDAIDRLHGSMTIVMITHRMAAVASADAVHVLDEGRIVECSVPA